MGFPSVYTGGSIAPKIVDSLRYDLKVVWIATSFNGTKMVNRHSDWHGASQGIPAKSMGFPFFAIYADLTVTVTVRPSVKYPAWSTHPNSWTLNVD